MFALADDPATSSKGPTTSKETEANPPAAKSAKNKPAAKPKENGKPKEAAKDANLPAFSPDSVHRDH